MKFIQTKVVNYSKYAKDLVWENAQDLEHVSVLHPNTNAYFEMLFCESFKKTSEYDVMIYRAKRKLLFITFHSFGFRRIVSKYNLHQVEYIPWLGITSALNSLLYDSDKEGYSTKMVDEVVLKVPNWLYLLKSYFVKSLARHAAIQCQEDEPFRERLEVLAKRGIKMPYRSFSVSTFEELTSRFYGVVPEEAGGLLSPSLGTE